MRPWGCPAYVLEPKIYEGKKLPKWDPKAKRGQFLGMSNRHASTIGLIRNLQTEAISAQYHVVYDEHFTTVPATVNMDDLQVPPNWIDLLTYSRDFVLQDENPAVIPELDRDWLNPAEILVRDQRQHRQAVPVNRLPAQPPEGVPAPWAGYDDDSDEDEAPALVNANPDEDDNDEAVVPVDNGSEEEEELPAAPPVDPDPPGRPQ